MNRASDVMLVVVLVALVGALVGWWRAHHRVARGNRKRMVRAMEGESRADELLAAAGFRVVDQQVTASFLVLIDGEEVWVHNRCDRIVERDGWVYVADVKTGDRARDPTYPPTRRQLLEYLLAHEADGVLLVDMDAEVVVEIEFPGLLD